MATLADFRSHAASILGIDNTTGGDQPLVDFYCNEAVREVLLGTRCYVTSTTYTGISSNDTDLNTTAVMGSGGFLDIIKMYWSSGGTQYPLERIPMEEIIEMRRSASSVGPTRYYALTGANLLMWYPAPASTDVLTIYYVPYPTEMSSGTNDPSTTTYGGIPKEQHRLIEQYMLWRVADSIDDASSGSGQVYFQNYERMLAQFRKDLGKRGGKRLSGIPIPSRRRGERWIPRPDQINA